MAMGFGSDLGSRDGKSLAAIQQGQFIEEERERQEQATKLDALAFRHFAARVAEAIRRSGRE